MKKHIITFKEWDEEGHSAIRTITIECQDPEKWFWNKYNDCDVQLLNTKAL